MEIRLAGKIEADFIEVHTWCWRSRGSTEDPWSSIAFTAALKPKPSLPFSFSWAIALFIHPFCRLLLSEVPSISASSMIMGLFQDSIAIAVLTFAGILALLANRSSFFWTIIALLVLTFACVFLFLAILLITLLARIAFVVNFTRILIFSVTFVSSLTPLTSASHVQCLPIPWNMVLAGFFHDEAWPNFFFFFFVALAFPALPFHLFEFDAGITPTTVRTVL